MFVKKKCQERLRRAILEYDPSVVESGMVAIVGPVIENPDLSEKVIDYFCSEISFAEALVLQKLFSDYDKGKRSQELEERLRTMASKIIARAEKSRGNLPISDEARSLLYNPR